VRWRSTQVRIRTSVLTGTPFRSALLPFCRNRAHRSFLPRAPLNSVLRRTSTALGPSLEEGGLASRDRAKRTLVLLPPLRRTLEGGHQTLSLPFPALLVKALPTVSISFHADLALSAELTLCLISSLALSFFASSQLPNLSPSSSGRLDASPSPRLSWLPTPTRSLSLLLLSNNPRSLDLCLLRLEPFSNPISSKRYLLSPDPTTSSGRSSPLKRCSSFSFLLLRFLKPTGRWLTTFCGEMF
jgi:hypothetical protein